MKTVNVLVPATIANMVCGFDILGLAVSAPCDEMTITLIDEPVVRIKHTDGFNLPEAPEKNVAGVALFALMEAYPQPIGFELVVNKQIMPGSGLGSSAAGSAGAVVGANYLLEHFFSAEDLVRFAMNGEKLATGVKHADNIAPSVYGGVTLIRSIFPLDIIRLPAPEMFISIVHPQLEVKTADARQILRKNIQLKNAIHQWGNIAGLVAGLFKNDYALIGRSLEDVLIEPVRSILIPGFDEVKTRSKEAGALGGGISGSGPSIFMMSETQATANAVLEVMKDVYLRLGIDCRYYLTTLNQQGVIIV